MPAFLLGFLVPSPTKQSLAILSHRTKRTTITALSNKMLLILPHLYPILDTVEGDSRRPISKYLRIFRRGGCVVAHTLPSASGSLISVDHFAVIHPGHSNVEFMSHTFCFYGRHWSGKSILKLSEVPNEFLSPAKAIHHPGHVPIRKSLLLSIITPAATNPSPHKIDRHTYPHNIPQPVPRRPPY